MKQMRVTEMFPDLFDGLPTSTVDRVSSIIGSDQLDGYEPRREDVALLISVDTGRISHEDAIEALKVKFRRISS